MLKLDEVWRLLVTQLATRETQQQQQQQQRTMRTPLGIYWR